MLAGLRAKYPHAEHPDIFPGQDGRDTAILTDMYITCFADQMTRNHKATARRYLFAAPGKFRNDTGLLKLLEPIAYHTLELNYVFANMAGLPGTPISFALQDRESDRVLTRAIQDYWVSFAQRHEPRSAFAGWPTVEQGRMLQFAEGGQPKLSSIDFRQDQCTHIVSMFDKVWG